MKRTLVACALGLIALGILVVVAIESRQISSDVHVAQNRIASETALAAQDFDALVATLESAWSARQIPSNAATTLAERVTEAPGQLRSPVLLIPGNARQRARIENSLERFTQAVSQAGNLTKELIADQTAYGESVAKVRDKGPLAVQRMRELGLQRSAADVFQLVVGSLDFATSGSSDREYELNRLLVTLARDQRIDANMPRELSELGAAAEIIISKRAGIEGRLSQLAITPVTSSAGELEKAVQDTYQSAVNRVERAGWLLAVYALLLLAAVGFVGYRLKDSYKTINDKNAELAVLNESLERRVSERTRELEDALADLKESQAQLVQAEKMSSLGQLVAGISHEINTPLLYLANNTTMIRERLEEVQSFVRRSIAIYSMQPSSFDKREDYQQTLARALAELKNLALSRELDADLEDALGLLGDCDDGLKDLTEIAQSLKDFSRLDRAPVGSFNVHQGIDKTLLIAKNLLKHKVTVTKDYGDIPAIVCSPSQINQVFLNLLSNAAQAIEESGEIHISTQLCAEGRVAIRFADTGSGIPTEIFEKIRDPFFTTKSPGSGTGLGLSIVDDIIRKHGGELLIDSEVGKGSVFTVVLPIAPPEGAAADDSREPAAAGGEPARGSVAPLAEAV